jgi:hypothetical protein
MKIQLLICTGFVLFICLFSAKTFAQLPADPGVDPMLDSTVIQNPIVEKGPINYAQPISVMAYPNPYLSIEHFTFKTSVAGRGSLVIYDVQGRKVATVFEGDLPPGDDRTITYNLGVIPQQPLIYIFTNGDQAIHGKLMPQ